MVFIAENVFPLVQAKSKLSNLHLIMLNKSTSVAVHLIFHATFYGEVFAA